MSGRNVHISTGSVDRFGRDFVDAWKRGEKGPVGELKGERVCFLDLATMLRTLTAKRLEILRTIQRQSDINTYELAKRLGRDYKNVHTDVRLLKDVGLVETTEGGTGLCVPFTKIHAEIDLAA